MHGSQFGAKPMGRQRASLQFSPRLQSLGGWALPYELPMIVLKQISKDWGGEAIRKVMKAFLQAGPAS